MIDLVSPAGTRVTVEDGLAEKLRRQGWRVVGAPVVPVESVADGEQGSGDSDEDAAPVVPVKRKPGRPPKK